MIVWYCIRWPPFGILLHLWDCVEKSRGYMAIPEKQVGTFRTDDSRTPSLHKAKHAFETAEMLREQLRFDCAANRYYYAVLHVASQDLGYRRIHPDSRKPKKWSHAELAAEYVRQYDPKAWPAISQAQAARNIADYTPHHVYPKTICRLLRPVAEMIIRAMVRKRIPKET